LGVGTTLVFKADPFIARAEAQRSEGEKSEQSPPPAGPPKGEFGNSEADLTPEEANIARRFAILTRLRNDGFITRDEYERHRAPNLGALLPYTQAAPSAGLERPVPDITLYILGFERLRQAFAVGAASEQDVAEERARILSGLLPDKTAPRKPASADTPLDDVDALVMTSHLVGFRMRGLIADEELRQELAAIDRLQRPPAPSQQRTATRYPTANQRAATDTAKNSGACD
jgi:hypothetical protein